MRPFPNVDGGHWQISFNAGFHPLWSRDGQELFYRTFDGVWAVSVESGDDFQFGAPERLIEGIYLAATSGRAYDVSPDGQRFLMIKSGGSAEGTSRPDLVMVENWFEELKRLVPTD